MKERSDDAPKGRALTMTDEQENNLRNRSEVLDSAGVIRGALVAISAELDATRDRVAEVERECKEVVRKMDAWRNATTEAHVALADSQAENAEARAMLVSVRGVLVAAEADNVSLRAALRAAEFCMEGDDNMALCPLCTEDGGGHLTHAPECVIGTALARPAGSREALRAWGVKVAFATKERCEEYQRRYRLTGIPFNSADAEEVVARLLEPRSGDDAKRLGETPTGEREA